MSQVRSLFLSMIVLACACGDGSADHQADADATPECPVEPPADAASCAGFASGAQCLYERCDDTGLVRATCDATTWSVQISSCTDLSCQGQACGAGTICAAQVGGALLIDCRPHSCGDGPLTCDCVCGGDRCDGNSYGEGAEFSCYIDCGADICP